MDIDEETMAIMGVTTRAQTMADSTLRLVIDVRPEDMQPAFRMFGTPGTPVALARLTNEVAVGHDRPKSVKGPYGEYARALILSGFFRSPDVWAAIGTDEEYLEWVKHQKSAFSGTNDLTIDGRDNATYTCVAAHVRRVEHGSGTAIKPPYSAIPLTHAEHQLSHQKGDSAIGDEDWWDKQRIKYLQLWAQETLKNHLFCESWTDVKPTKIVSWARDRQLEQYLPNAIKTYNEASTESETASES